MTIRLPLNRVSQPGTGLEIRQELEALLEEAKIKSTLSIFQTPEKQAQLHREIDLLEARLTSLADQEQIVVGAPETRLIDISLILISTGLSFYLFGYDGISGMKLLNQVTQTGLRRQIIQRLVVMFLLLYFVTMIFHGLLGLQYVFHGVSLQTPLGLIDGFRSTVLAQPLWVYLLIHRVAFRFLSLAVISLICGLLFYLFRLGKQVYLTILGLFLSSLWLTLFIPVNSAWSYLRWSNPFGWFNFTQAITRLMFLRPSSRWLVHEWIGFLSLLTILTLIALLIGLANQGAKETERHHVINTYIRKDTLSRWVWRRFWWRSGSFFLLCILIAFAAWSAFDYSVSQTPSEYTINHYLSLYGGVLNDHKEAQIMAEKERLDNLYSELQSAIRNEDHEQIVMLRLELIHYDGFQEFLQKVEMAKQTPSRELLDTRPFEVLFSTKHSFNFWFRMFLSQIIGLLIITLGWESFVDPENRSLALTTRHGHSDLYRRLSSQNATTSLIVTLLSFGSLFVAVQRSWTVRWDVSLYSAINFLIEWPVYVYYPVWLCLVLLSNMVLYQLCTLLLHYVNRISAISLTVAVFITSFTLRNSVIWFLNPFGMLWPGDSPRSIYLALNLLSLLAMAYWLYQKGKRRFLRPAFLSTT